MSTKRQTKPVLHTFGRSEWYDRALDRYAAALNWITLQARFHPPPIVWWQPVPKRKKTPPPH